MAAWPGVTLLWGGFSFAAPFFWPIGHLAIPNPRLVMCTAFFSDARFPPNPVAAEVFFHLTKWHRR